MYPGQGGCTQGGVPSWCTQGCVQGRVVGQGTPYTPGQGSAGQGSTQARSLPVCSGPLSSGVIPGPLSSGVIPGLFRARGKCERTAICRRVTDKSDKSDESAGITLSRGQRNQAFSAGRGIRLSPRISSSGLYMGLVTRRLSNLSSVLHFRARDTRMIPLEEQ